MLRKIVFCIVSVLILSCKGDNDDVILENDTTNINFETGIVFGTIDPAGESYIYKYTSEGIFLATNFALYEADREYSACPFSETSFTYDIAQYVGNIARGVREMPTTDIADANALGEQFYILEYETGESTEVDEEEVVDEEEETEDDTTDEDTEDTEVETDEEVEDDRKTIQFYDANSLIDEETDAYLSYIIETLLLITSDAADAPLELNADGECE